jgi:hypothetical protein
MVINGHLAWTCQNASGNRGDDFRALKLCELQLYTFLHLNKETSIYSVLGMQGEEKAGKQGLKTVNIRVLSVSLSSWLTCNQVINPVYTTFIAHLNAKKCPLGAMVFYHHWLHDVYGLTDKMSIDWSINKSWRQVCVLLFHHIETNNHGRSVSCLDHPRLGPIMNPTYTTSIVKRIRRLVLSQISRSTSHGTSWGICRNGLGLYLLTCTGHC